MVRCLGFESKIEARYFCKFHGLNVTEEFVVLDRTSYVEPEESWLPRRSQNIIESKLSSRISEVSITNIIDKNVKYHRITIYILYY